jgi:arabinoxylan arabinofuranohydrolase
MGQAFNPYLPSYEYVPDGEPHVFGDRVYVYGSHDRFDGMAFCLNDYVVWSAPVSDLSAWRYEGVSYQKKQTPPYFSDDAILWAPDVCQGKDGRYYLYFFVGRSRPNDNRIHAAVSDKPQGPFAYYGALKYPDGKLVGTGKKELKSFDPGVFVDENGKVYLYSGFGAKIENPFIQHGWHSTRQGPMVYELDPNDMLTVIQGPHFIGVPSDSTSKDEYQGHGFFEASSMRKFNGLYYFIYSSVHGHELCYATSHSPVSDFHYGGILISIGDIGYHGRKESDATNYTGNTHGSVEKINGHYYVFYHRQTNLKQFSRQGCAEEVHLTPDGHFEQAEMTSCGLNGGPLEGLGYYPARIACNLVGKHGTKFYGFVKLKWFNRHHPYFTQDAADQNEDGGQHIANLRDGSWCGFKYFSLANPKAITMQVRGNFTGLVLISTTEDGGPIGRVALSPSKEVKDFAGTLLPISGVAPLYFHFYGKGHCDFFGFELKKE